MYKDEAWILEHCEPLSTQRLFKQFKEMGYHSSILYRMATLKNAMEDNDRHWIQYR